MEIEVNTHYLDKHYEWGKIYNKYALSFKKIKKEETFNFAIWLNICALAHFPIELNLHVLVKETLEVMFQVAISTSVVCTCSTPLISFYFYKKHTYAKPSQFFIDFLDFSGYFPLSVHTNTCKTKLYQVSYIFVLYF